LQIFLSVKELGLKYPNSISNGYNNQHLRGVTMENLTENQEKAAELLKRFDPESKIYWDDRMKIPKFIKGKLSKPSSENPKTIACTFLEDNRSLLDMQQGLDEKLEVSTQETDKNGFHHLSFHQTLSGIPVFEGSIQVHINPEGEVIAYKDNRITDVDVSLEPDVTEQSAVKTALVDLGAEKKIKESNARLSLYRNSEKKLHLVWEVRLLESGEFGSRYYYIDAHTGELLYKFAQIRNALSRKTYTAHGQYDLPGELLLEDDKMTTDDEVAVAAHEHAKTIYDYYKDTFDRDSYDNMGATIVSTVHYGQNYNNAQWGDEVRQLIFGDGDGFRFKPLAFALDIVAHEFTHAVSSNTAHFAYREESGALDESFADIFGILISNGDPITNWEIGEEVYTPGFKGDALRDLSDPIKYGQPDHIDNCMHLNSGELPDLNKNDNGYVHVNNGVPNKVAYLIIEGGTHNGIPIAGIGRKKAEQIYYLALTAYLSSSTLSRWTFEEARMALLNACRQLYGDNGIEYTAIKNAWAAVGIGQPAGDLLVVEKEVSPNFLIPDHDPKGIQSSIYVSEESHIKDIRVYVNIIHPRVRELKISLISPSGENFVLHDRMGISEKNIIRTYNLISVPNLKTLIGSQIHGEWILTVSDLVKGDAGSLSKWGLKFLVQKAEKKELKTEVSPIFQVTD
jgi:bacillolysin